MDAVPVKASDPANALTPNKCGSSKASIDDLIKSKFCTQTDRNNWLIKLDTHVNTLLDSVRNKDKKRKTKTSNFSVKELDKLDVTTPDSILCQTNLKNLLNPQTFASLPYFYQHKLIKLLPECDREITEQGWLKLSSAALNNEFFTRAQQLWLSRLKEGKLQPEVVQKRKQESEKELIKIDPWKLKHFEPVWGYNLSQEKRSNEQELKSNFSREQRQIKLKQMANINILDTMYQAKFPHAKRTGPKVELKRLVKQPSKPLSNLGYILVDEHGKVQHLTNFAPPITPVKIDPKRLIEPNRSVRRRKTEGIDEKRSHMICQKVVEKSSNNRMFYISSLGKIHPMDDRTEREATSSLEQRHVFSIGQSETSRTISNTTPKKPYQIQIQIRNPQASKYRVAETKSSSTKLCECSHRSLVSCIKCTGLCHRECINPNSGICNTCNKS